MDRLNVLASIELVNSGDHEAVFSDGRHRSFKIGNEIRHADGSRTAVLGGGNELFHSDGSLTEREGNGYTSTDGWATRLGPRGYHHSDGTMSARRGGQLFNSDGSFFSFR